VGEIRGTYGVSVGKPEGKRSPSKPRCTWEDNIRMDLVDVGCETMDVICLAGDRDMG